LISANVDPKTNNYQLSLMDPRDGIML